MSQEEGVLKEKYSVNDDNKEYHTIHTINMVDNIPYDSDEAPHEMSVPLQRRKGDPPPTLPLREGARLEVHIINMYKLNKNIRI